VKSSMKSTMIQCRNLKISLSLMNTLNLERVENFRETNCSYLIYNNVYNKCVITVYKHSMRRLHITGICNKSDLHTIFDFVREVLKNVILTGSIQNSLFSFKNVNKNINFNFKNVMKFVNNIYNIKFNAEVFPAIFFRPILKFKKMGFPTILLFSSGSYVLIGGCRMKYIKKAHILVTNIINNKLE
jgi:TATA-box binding protein (TBP) (component of TFIID and TFIIIB)